MTTAKYTIGTQYKSAGKRPHICTVTDIWRVYNHYDELVKVRYVATHQFMGQTVTDYDVCETTIARGKAAMETA